MKKITYIALLITLTFFGCNIQQGKVTHKGEVAEHAKHWSYEGKKGVDNWSHLSESYKDCGGTAQSPINISTNATAFLLKAHKLSVQYGNTGVDVVNNGHTEQFNIAAGNSIIFDGKTYELKQFHMHSLSEHTIDGKHSPLEIHFVNKAKDNTYAVIAVLFEEGKSSPFFDTFLTQLPKEEGSYTTKALFDITSVLPSTKHYFYYSGSFTTPPCTEVVEWIVLKEKQTASKEQLEQLHTLLHDNYRPIQEINGRKINIQ